MLVFDVVICSQWNLVRARIITNIDKEMSERERKAGNHMFWEWDQHDTEEEGMPVRFR